MKRNAQRYGSLVLALAALCTTDLSARTTFSTITDVASVSQAASTNKPCQQEAKAPQLGIDPLQDVIDAMTIEEKVYLLVGAGTSATDLEAAIIGQTRKLVPGAAGTTFPIARLGIPAIVLADGPAGLRIDPIREGDSATYYCTHFPIGTLLASTWNQDLVEEVGKSIGNEVLE